MLNNQANRKLSSAPLRFRALLFPGFLALLLGLVMVGSVDAWRWMQKPTSFPVTHIVVRGDLTHVSTAQLQQIIASQIRGGFFSLNLRQVQRAVLQFPWVKSVSFRRVWPNTLHATLVEQVPLARFGGVGVVNADGKVFYPAASTIPDNLPLLEGPLDEVGPMTNFYNNASDLIKLIGLSINMLTVDTDQNWTVVLSNHIVVKIGREDTLNRFKRFVAVYPKIVEGTKTPIAAVDLRYPDGMAVEFVGAKTA